MSAPAPITVLHIITRMVKGGAQENTLATVLKVDRERYRSILVTGPSHGPEGSLLEQAHAQGADVRMVPSLVREVAPAQDLRALKQIVGIIRHEKPAIVHTHTSKAGVLGRMAARLCRVPILVHTPHGHVFHDYYGRTATRVFIATERFCARFTHRLVMLTRNELQDHLALRIAPEERFAVIHSGVDFSRFIEAPTCRGTMRASFGIPPDARVLGTVGRLVPVKGQTYLIEALPAILGSVPNAHLVLVGDGPLRQDLEHQATRLGVASRVHFAGLREDVASCLADFDLFVLPSLNEGMGRVLVEAMAMRLPVVASDVSGIRDLVHHEQNGLRVPAGDAQALASACIRLLTDNELARRFAEEGFRTVVPAYSQEEMIARIEALYADLLAETAGTRVARHLGASHDPKTP
ncbi:MAG: glycosyltransferase family 4 protein [Chthonomonadales bacterium]